MTRYTRTIQDTRPAEAGGGPITRTVCGQPHPSGHAARFCTRSPHADERHVNRSGNEWRTIGLVECGWCGATGDPQSIAEHEESIHGEEPR